MNIRNVLLLTVSFLIIASSVEAQRRSSAYNGGNRSRLVTPYFGARAGAYGYGGRGGGYWLSPYMGYRAPIVAKPSLPPVTGPVERYSEVEYGEIVQMAIQAARQNSPSSGAGGPRASIVDQTTISLTGETAYQPIATGVSDILDRGILLLPTGEELRLRGVAMPSTTDRNEVSRLYAKEGMQALRNLTQGKEVYILLDEPLRDSDGRLLGTVLLADGTELNRRMLELGYGSLKIEDFPTGVDYSDLSSYQQAAQQNRVGLWSKGY